MIRLLTVERLGADEYQVVIDVNGDVKRYAGRVITESLMGRTILIGDFPPLEGYRDFEEYLDPGALADSFVFRCVRAVLFDVHLGKPVNLPMDINSDDWAAQRSLTSE